MGGGTSDIAVISLGGVVRAKSLKVAGDKFNQDIISYLRDEFKILIGEKTAENVKIAIGSVSPKGSSAEASIKGRDLVTGLPREVIVTDTDIRQAILPSITLLVDAIKEVLETTPPEIISDVMHRGAVLTGGSVLLQGLPELFNIVLKIPIHVADDPLSAVARGTGIILEDLEAFREILIENQDALPPH